jgi:hypothetical protein
MTLELIRQKLARCRYLSDPEYVYKYCKDSKTQNECIIVLKKSKETVTNESRQAVVDSKCAQFRADQLGVFLIMDLNNPTIEYDMVENEYWLNSSCCIKTIYRKGDIVCPHAFDNNLNKLQSSGIYYFNSLEPAFYYRGLPKDYTGKWIRYYEDTGAKYSEGSYNNGKCHGIWNFYYSNGIKFATGEYINDEKCPMWIYWKEDGSRVENSN